MSVRGDRTSLFQLETKCRLPISFLLLLQTSPSPSDNELRRALYKHLACIGALVFLDRTDNSSNLLASRNNIVHQLK